MLFCYTPQLGLDSLSRGREAFSAGKWAYFLVQSVGLDPFSNGFEAKTPGSLDVAPRARAIGLALLRLVPLVEEGFHLVELGPRGTGKSYLYERAAPRAHLLSGGKASVAKLFVDTSTGEKGLVAGRDVVAFDEISSTSFPKDAAVSALRTYMESSQVSRGKTTVEGRASIVMLGNIDGTPQEILSGESSEGGHLFEPLPSRIREDTAIMDRIHAYLPGWEVPKVGPLAEGLGLTTPYLAECLSRLRQKSLSAQIQQRADFKGNLKRRDREAALSAASGLLKLIYPGLAAGDRSMDEVPRPVLRWALWMGLEARLRVRQQQHRILPSEFKDGDFRFTVDPTGADRPPERVFLPEEQVL